MREHAHRLTGVGSTIFAEMSALAARTGSVNLGQGFPDEDGPAEVVALEPYYDSYAAAIAMAGGVRVPVTLRAPDFRLDVERLRAAISPRTRVILLNSPHNPTGDVLPRD
jgi:N-succinyldiaminopimelate aminotransferase